MVSSVASQQEGSGFEPTGRLESLYVEFTCSSCVFVGFPTDQNMQVRLTGDSKLPVGANVGVNSCLSLYYVIDW